MQHPRLLVQLFQWKFTKRRNKIKLNLVREAAKMLFKQQLILWLLHLIANNLSVVHGMGTLDLGIVDSILLARCKLFNPLWEDFEDIFRFSFHI